MRFHARAFVGAVVACVAVACAADLSGFAEGPDTGDAGEAGTPPPPGDDAGAPCATFTCGTLCVKAEDPVFGCSADRNCQPCPGPANATSTCASGKCAVACSAPFLDCNGKPDDGCEVDPKSDPQNCGTCGHACPAAMPYCVAGACASNCPFTLCGAACVDTSTSVANCGGCGMACPQPTTGNGTPSCSGSKCAFTCSTGYANCDQDAGNGCKVFTQGNDVAHCGSCNACPALPNETALCTAGACSSACNSSYVDCNTLATDGCECHVTGQFICLSSKTCGECSDIGDPCGVAGDCCSTSSKCESGKCCKKSGTSCTLGTECCTGICSTTCQ